MDRGALAAHLLKISRDAEAIGDVAISKILINAANQITFKQSLENAADQVDKWPQWKKDVARGARIQSEDC